MWMNQKYSSICCLLVFQIINISEAILIISPTSQVVQREDTARFNCSTDLRTHGIKWRFWYVGAVNPQDIYLNGRFMNGYANNTRYSVDASENGRFDLVITNVQLHDAGRFDCVENIPSGDMSSADLTVKERDDELIVTPPATAAVAGQQVRLTCLSSHKQNVWWKLIRAGSSTEDEVYLGASGFVNGFSKSGRFSIDLDNGLGRYDLLIENVQPSDAGRFICVDKGGLGQQKSAQLTVVDSSPRCSSNIPIAGTVGENTCGIEPDQVSMFCHVNFTGSIAPGLEWINARTGLVISEGHFYQNTQPTTVNLTMKMSATRHTIWTDFVCRIVGTNTTNQDRCSPISAPVNHIDLSHKTERQTLHQERVTCTVNNTDTCQYSWMRRYNKDEVLVVSGSTLDLTDVGHYWCKAECLVRGRTCTVYPVAVEFLNPIRDSNKVLIGAILGCLSILVVVGLGLIFILRSKGVLGFRIWKNKSGQIYKLPNVKPDQSLKSFTLMGGQLFAVHEKSNVVSVHNVKPPFRFVKNFEIPDMKSPEDIVGCKQQSCLFISDSETLCVWKVSLSDHHDALNQTFIPNLYPNSTHMLSLTPSENVMLTYQKNEDDAPPSNNIAIYDKAGLPNKIVKLKNENDPLCHAVMTGEDHYVVSFGGRLGIADKYENVVKSYPMRDNPPFPAEKFGEIFFDGNRLVYVLDCTNSKVLILKTDLTACDSIDLTSPEYQSEHQSELLQKFVVWKNKILLGFTSGYLQMLNVPEIISEDDDVEAGYGSSSATQIQDMQTKINSLERKLAQYENSNGTTAAAASDNSDAPLLNGDVPV